MARIPRNRGRQLELLRSGRQKAIIVGGVPIPAGVDGDAAVLGDEFRALNIYVRDEIDCQSPLVRALPRSRFRRALSEQASLPSGMAERLEDFEMGLRSAGLIKPGQLLVQGFNSPCKFRVEQGEAVDTFDGHDDVSVVSEVARRSDTEGRSRAASRTVILPVQFFKSRRDRRF